MFFSRSHHPESSASPLGSTDELRFHLQCPGEHLLDGVKPSSEFWSSTAYVCWEMKTSRRVFLLAVQFDGDILYWGPFYGLAYLNTAGHVIWRSTAYRLIADHATMYQHESLSFTQQQMCIRCQIPVAPQIFCRRAGGT